jgi:hypothetical protein
LTDKSSARLIAPLSARQEINFLADSPSPFKRTLDLDTLAEEKGILQKIY